MALSRWSQIRGKRPLLRVSSEVPVVDIIGTAWEAEGGFVEIAGTGRRSQLADHSLVIRVGSRGIKEVAQPPFSPAF